MSPIRGKYKTYKEYLLSPEWKSVRRKKDHMQRVCQCCGDRIWLEHHHKTYERIGYEKLSDVQVLCGENARGCHYFWHERQKGFWHIKPSYIFHRIGCFLHQYTIEQRSR